MSNQKRTSLSSLISIQFGLHTLYRLRELPDNKILGNQIPEGATVVVDIQKVITVRKIGSRGNNDSSHFNNDISH